jgi:choline dehydrogenase-like flavoprotein
VLITWLPRALAAGAEVRDLAMAGRIEHNEAGRATGIHYIREGRWRFQRARNVVVACYAIETPRLLLNSATRRYPNGLANSSGLVGKNLMVQANQAVWGIIEQEIRAYKGPPSLAISEHWNYVDEGKDFLHCRWSGRPRNRQSGVYGANACSTRWKNTIIRSA